MLRTQHSGILFQVEPADKLKKNGLLYGMLIISIAEGHFLMMEIQSGQFQMLIPDILGYVASGKLTLSADSTGKIIFFWRTTVYHCKDCKNKNSIK